MKETKRARVVAAMALSVARLGFAAQSVAPPAAQAAAPKVAPAGATAIARENAAWVDKLTASIAGKEALPAREVFKNVTSLGGVPAGRMLRVMQFGYARSLGVTCSHCHDTNAWEAETKRKDVARQMAALVQSISMEQLPKIKGLTSERPIVNCTTCHRGQVKPALDLPSAP